MSRILLVGEAPALRRRLEAGGLVQAAVQVLTDAALDAADVVAFAGKPGSPMPGDAIRAAAAGCLLVVPRAEPARGFIRGADHLAYDDDDECIRLLAAVASFPEAYQPIAVFGQLTARAVLRAP